MKNFCFTVDDNIRFLKEIEERKYNSIFEHPYLNMYKRLHNEFDLKIQLNLFYRMEGFELWQMGKEYRKEWADNASWLKLSFHSEFENKNPYESSGYDEVFCHCEKVNKEIKRFASNESLGKTTTIHYCNTTKEGVNALKDNGVVGLLGLFDNRTSYSLEEEYAKAIRGGEIIELNGISFSGIDIILNCFSKEEILMQLRGLLGRDTIKVMIHEQYFYEEYKLYQPDFEEKLRATFIYLNENNYKSSFFEELI